MVAFAARPLFALVGDHGDGAELDALHGLPRLCVTLGQMHTVKTGVGEGLHESGFLIGAADTTRPQRGIGAQMGRDFFVADNIRNRHPTADRDHPEQFAE